MITTLDLEHVRLLDAAGYRHLTMTDVWINQRTNRAISSETVGRHSREWLMRWLKGEISQDFMIRNPGARRVRKRP